MINTTKRIFAATYCATLNSLLVATTATCVGFIGIAASPFVFVYSFMNVMAQTSLKGN